MALGVAVAIGVWWLLEAQPSGRLRAARHGLLVVVVALLVVAPWTLRNARVLGAFVPVSTIGWFAAGEGNTFETTNWLADRGPMHVVYKARYFQTPNELARADVAKRWTLQRVAEEQPDWALQKLIREGALLLSPDSIDPLSRRCCRVSMGEGFALPYAWLTDINEGIGTIRAAGVEVLGMTPRSDAINIDTLQYSSADRVAVMLGAEGPGLTEGAMAMATRLVGIPMSGAADSLNVGNAAAVAFYALRQARKS